MKLSCWTALFPYLPWSDACRIICALGFSYVDLIVRPASARESTPWDGLDLESIVERPESEGAALRSRLAGLGLEPAAMLVMPPGEWGKRPEDATAQFRSVAQFCEVAGVPVVVFAASDVVGPSQARPVDWNTVVARLRAMADIASDRGILLAVEPNFSSAARTPPDALRLVEDVPGLSLVMDLAHFVLQGYRQEELDALWPFARHVHVRQARPGRLQARLDAGTIDFGAMVASLHSVGYEGTICIENILLPDAAWLTSDYLDPVAETVALRDLLRKLM